MQCAAIERLKKSRYIVDIMVLASGVFVIKRGKRRVALKLNIIAVNAHNPLRSALRPRVVPMLYAYPIVPPEPAGKMQNRKISGFERRGILGVYDCILRYLHPPERDRR